MCVSLFNLNSFLGIQKHRLVCIHRNLARLCLFAIFCSLFTMQPNDVSCMRSLLFFSCGLVFCCQWSSVFTAPVNSPMNPTVAEADRLAMNSALNEQQERVANITALWKSLMDKEALHSILNDTQISTPNVYTAATVAATLSTVGRSQIATRTLESGVLDKTTLSNRHLDVLGDRTLMERLTVLKPSPPQLNFRQSERGNEDEEEEEEDDDVLPDRIANVLSLRSTPSLFSSSSSSSAVSSFSSSPKVPSQPEVALKMIESVKSELNKRVHSLKVQTPFSKLIELSAQQLNRPLQEDTDRQESFNEYEDPRKPAADSLPFKDNFVNAGRSAWTSVESDRNDEENSEDSLPIISDDELDGDILDGSVGSVSARFNISLFTLEELNRTLADIEWLQSQRPSLGQHLGGLQGKGRNNRNRIAQKMEYLERLYRMNQKPHTKRGEGPQLSVVSPLDVLRQKLLLEMTRRKLKESMNQVEENAELLKNLGRR